MKAICVFSGGLDSMLAASLIRAQGIDVLALFFETPFFTAQRAKKSAGAIELPFEVVNITERHMKVVTNPTHGYGGNMNPCIDCHALMFRIAGEMLEPLNASFIITGEVLGQRPMSQNKKSLNIVAEESGYGDLILRPLSAKCLPPTIPEKSGWVERERLMDFQGRTRKPQMGMARRMKFKEYPTPAGGCLLTEKGFSRRLKDLLITENEPEIREIELLKLGRHFRLSPHAKIIVGRNKKENEIIGTLSADNDIVLRSANRPGPTVLGLGNFTREAVDLAATITAAYSDSEEGETASVRLMKKNKEEILTSRSLNKKTFKKYML
jgi:tRNA U34 2-thiouridine synthase MnmA/TrmU